MFDQSADVVINVMAAGDEQRVGVRERVETVVGNWAGIPTIANTQSPLCDLWLIGPHAKSAPCDEALEDLIERLRAAFPDRNMRLRPRDFDEFIRNVDGLVAFVLSAETANAPRTAAAAPQPLPPGPPAGKTE